MVLSTHPRLSFPDPAALSGTCDVVLARWGLNGALYISSDSFFTRGMARVASQSVTSVLETRENPSSADGQSESYPLPFQIHEKEEEELNEKSERDSGINEEPLLTADQV